MSHETRIVTRRRVLVELVLLAGMAGTPVAWGQTVIYVDARATGAGNGASWADAFTKVQPALNAAQSGDQVWVAAGRYVENITLKNGVALYGGFAGTETELGQRNWVVNETILDGNQAGSVVRSGGTPTATTRIDGFMIANGAGDPYPSDRCGGGIRVVYSSVTIANNTIRDNNVTGGAAFGGGLYLQEWSGTLVNNTIADNSAARGGGIYLTGGFDGDGPSGTIANNTITRNVANSGGGGLWIDDTSPVIANNVITANGAPYAGGMYLTDCSSLLANNTIVGNAAVASSLGEADGVVTLHVGQPTIVNTIVAFNYAGIHRSSSQFPTLRNNCVYGNTYYNYKNLTDPTGSNGNISQDPRLVDGRYGNWHIQPDSPCVDGGDNAHIVGDLDIDGQPRILPAGGAVDIGADESDGTVWPVGPYTIVRVSPDGDDRHDGASWTTPKRTVQAAITAASALAGDVWVRAGTYPQRITLRPHVHVFGGFAGTELQLAERDWSTNVTVLDAERQGSAVTVSKGFAATTLDGFTITNGSGTVVGTTRRGGGVYGAYASPTMANNTFTDSAADEGGGLCLERCAYSTIANNMVVGNTATQNGGGLYIVGAELLIVANNTVVSNRAGLDGGAFFSDGCRLTIANTIVAFNSSGLYGVYAPAGLFRNNCVYGNVAYDFKLTSNLTGANGNISQDPLFADRRYAGNWHIRPGSPCVNAGSNADAVGEFDIDRQARIQPAGGTVDMGADESAGTVWPSGPYVVVRVSPDGDDRNDGSSWTAPKRTIQAASDAAGTAGGEVWARAGTYAERITLPPYAHVYGGFAGSETQLGERDWKAHVTVLDGQQQGPVVTVRAGFQCSTLDGFTITHGSAADGGGVHVEGASPVIANNVITANAAAGRGGGLFLADCFSSVADNIIHGNVVTDLAGCGAGLHVERGAPLIVNQLIYGNQATGTNGRGGAGFFSASSASMVNTTIAHNGAGQDGGGLCFLSSGATVTNTIVAFNSSGIYGTTYPAPPTLTYNCVYGNTQYNYLGVGNPTGINGNISQDPQFLDPQDGNYRLPFWSPCVDAGQNDAVPADITTDLDGKPRIVDGDGNGSVIVDMGAYETETGSLLCRGDLNCDAVVSFDDINPFVLALSNWELWKLTYPNCPEQNADVNGDGQYGGLNGFGDINPFVQLLASGGGQPIPCP